MNSHAWGVRSFGTTTTNTQIKVEAPSSQTDRELTLCAEFHAAVTKSTSKNMRRITVMWIKERTPPTFNTWNSLLSTEHEWEARHREGVTTVDTPSTGSEGNCPQPSIAITLTQQNSDGRLQKLGTQRSARWHHCKERLVGKTLE